jgi:kumamolisin
VHYTFDVTSARSSYEGESVRVSFQGSTDFPPSSDFFVDDVTVTVSY